MSEVLQRNSSVRRLRPALPLLRARRCFHVVCGGVDALTLRGVGENRVEAPPVGGRPADVRADPAAATRRGFRYSVRRTPERSSRQHGAHQNVSAKAERQRDESPHQRHPPTELE